MYAKLTNMLSMLKAVIRKLIKTNQFHNFSLQITCKKQLDFSLPPEPQAQVRKSIKQTWTHRYGMICNNCVKIDNFVHYIHIFHIITHICI